MSALQQAKLYDPNSTLTRDEKLAEMELKLAASEVPDELAEPILEQLQQLSELDFARAWEHIGLGLAAFWQDTRAWLDASCSRVLTISDDPSMSSGGPFLEGSRWCIQTK